MSAGLVYGALGTDTGGSIRLPAACCGVVGLKPTYGRVSRAGAMPLSWSLDHVGPLARTVRDAAVLLGVIAGADPRDATASTRPVPDYVTGLDRPIAGLRVGVPDRYYEEGVDDAVRTAVQAAIEALRGLGAQVVECPLPDPAPLNDVANVIARCESAAVHARIVRESPHALQPAVRARIEVGFHVSAHDYLQATRLRARATRTFVNDVFARVDLLVAPTDPRARARPGGREGGVARRHRPAHGPLLAPDAALERARAAGAQPALRLRDRRAARGPSDDRPPLRRGDAAPRRACVRASRGLVAAAPAARLAVPDR